MRVVLATGNAGKQREFAALLEPRGYELLLQTDLGVSAADETGASFEANALIKARHAASATGLPALADDSGLEVDALDGRPGVQSARYAGPGADDAANNALLLRELAAVPESRRGARYRCVIAFVRSADDTQPLLAGGSWEGVIATAPRGSGGFGYDALFIPRGFIPRELIPAAAEGLTAAELPAAVKNAVSHRALALKRLLAQLR